jgi:NADH-ubiquinone oxidoreductase chain 6
MILNLILTKVFSAGALLSCLFSITASSSVVSVILLIAGFVFAALLLINLGLVFVGLSYIIIYVGAIAVLFLFVIMMININIKEINTSDKEYTQNLPLAILIAFIFTIFYSSLIVSPISELDIFSLINKYFYNNNLEYSFTQIFNLINIFDNKNINLDSNTLFLSNKMSNEIIHYTSFPNGDFFSLEIVSFADTYLRNFEQISSLGFGLYNTYPLAYLLTGFILLFSMYSAVILTKRN